MQKSRWIIASMFAWCLAGAVALAVYSGRPSVVPDAATARAELVPDPEGKAHDQTLPAQTSPSAKGFQVPAPSNPKLKAIKWQPSFEDAMKVARRQGKPVMIDFYTDWCHWCKVLDSDVYTNKGVISESANWVSVKVNAEKRPDVARTYGVSGFPYIAFVSSDGKPFDAVPGYAPMPDFLDAMRSAYSKWTPPLSA